MTTKSTVITRKDMKEPDRFQQVAGQAASWATAHKREVRVVAVAALVIVVLVAAFLALQSSRAQRAGAAASELLRTVSGQVSATPLPGDSVPTFPTEEAKQRAIVTAADQLLGSASGGAAALASLAKGDAHYKLREWDAARAAYDRYLGLTSTDDSLRFGALEGLALVAEAQGKLDEAAQGWARVGQEAPAFADRADLERARVLAQAGKTDEARQLLSKFAEQHKESPLSGEAAERLSHLGAK